MFISYGRQSNDRLLQYYGFCDVENPYDSYDFGAGFLDLIIKYVDEISVKVPATASLSPQDRLKQIASALRNTDVKNLSTTKSAAAQKSVTPTTSGDELNTRYFRTPPASLIEDKSATSSSSQPLLNHFDDITVRAMRALYCTPEEWQKLGTLTSLDALGVPLSSSTEKAVATALADIVRFELSAKATTLEDDMALLAQLRASAASGIYQYLILHLTF